MKRLMGVVVALAVALPSIGEPVQGGAYEMWAEANIDVADTEFHSTVPMTGGLGYYFADGWQAGGFVTQGKREWGSFWGVGSVWALGAYAQYDWDFEGHFVPCAALSVAILDGERKSDTVAEVSLVPGLKIYFTEDLALCIRLHLKWANEGVYDFKREGDPRHLDAKFDGDGDEFGVSASAGFRLSI
jgi:hypothetical protein